jgi:hypothetical protein
MHSTFVESVCLPFLLNAQNADGGWGFKPGAASRAESTAWALIALTESEVTPAQREAAFRAMNFLRESQLADGSWPASPELREGSWVTSVAGLSLARQDTFTEQLNKAAAWLVRETPGEAGLLHRAVRSVFGKKNAGQNFSYFGWSWTAGTASWVEPTSYAILFLRLFPPDKRPGEAERRLRLAETMLCDRMCPGGGWNCGNPMVYGVPGEPQVTSTVWALLALRENRERPEVQQSLAWLEGFADSIKSPASLALRAIALRAYGNSTGIATALETMYESSEIAWNVPEVAWSILALSGTLHWLQPKSAITNSAGGS